MVFHTSSKRYSKVGEKKLHAAEHLDTNNTHISF